MDTINSIFMIVFAVFGIIGAISGLSKGLVCSAIKVVSIILAVFVAFTVTPMVLTEAYEIALPQWDELVAPLGELLTASPTLKAYLPTLVMSMLAPLVFLVVLLVCLLAVGIVRGIINLILKAVLPKKPGVIGRLGGFVFGLVAGVLTCLCIVFPVTGYFTVVPDIYVNVREFVSTEEQPIDPELEQTIINLPNIQGAKIINDLGLQYFEQIATYTDGEAQVYVFDDIKTITSMASPIMRFLGSMSSIDAIDTQALRDCNSIISTNKTLRTITAELLSTAATKWMDNQEFLGINLKQQMGPDYAVALDMLLEDLSTTTEATVNADIYQFTKAIDTLKHIYDYSNLLNTDGVTMEELEGKLTDVLLSLSTGTVDLVHELISGDVMQEIGVQNPEVVADLVADVISSAVNNLSDHQTAKDAAAINSIMHFASGDTSVSAQDVVDDIVHSPAIKQAIADAVNVENPPVITVLPENKQLIEQALQDLDDEELAENIKTLFGIN